MSNGSDPLRVVQLSFASSLEEYLERVRALGAVEGHNGDVQISPTLQPVLEAMHHVLAGGEVQVNIVRGGQPDIFRELQHRAAQATHETNALNQSSGNTVVTAI
ncbi:hypothetical protein [Hyalangium sp.]|uniref:hypothetical protein n=1 Tax=Hyalangium sp. TaxID=2028555 RepID=UPI002D52A6C2|nr:hypothetical protein [Hyalangium sp.]HYH95156.1 hypothetical protein [Hyalangium sp.]